MEKSNAAYIFRRRSVRSFCSGSLSDEVVEQLLRAGMSAPSACCRDPWEFVVLRTRDELCRAAAVLPNGGFLKDAGVGILVCGSPADAHAGELSYLLQDCSAAIENILLAAPEFGLGGCWLGVHPRMERVTALQREFGLPEDVLVAGAVALGVPETIPPARDRFKRSKVHWGKW